LATQIFDAVEAAPTDDPYGGVIAANRMITRLLGEIADFASMKGASLAEHGK
jgi:cholesterol transport system auxiliary component